MKVNEIFRIQYNSRSWLKTAAFNWNLNGLVIEESNFRFLLFIQILCSIFENFENQPQVDKWKKIIQFGNKYAISLDST